MSLKLKMINHIKENIKKILVNEGIESSIEIVSETPPEKKMGDIAFPMFKYSKSLNKKPYEIAVLLKEKLMCLDSIEKIEIKGPYLNIYLSKALVMKELSLKFDNEGNYILNKLTDTTKVVVEFSCPNTNKPLHLGHCRNNILGDSISRILSVLGYDVVKVNLINDRGIHICKSMLAYKLFGNETTPNKEKKKSDHLVGDFYVKYAEEANKNKDLETQSILMLKQWEQGEKDIIKLWEKMNKWAIDGIKETYNRMKIDFDLYQFESDTYLLGKDIVSTALMNNIVYKEEDGSIWINNEDVGLDKKILLRNDGTSIYITQDIGTAVERHKTLKFDRMIYVVGSEQIYHFQTLFAILKKMGYSWADDCYHLSYGMVNLPDGKMKSREGNVVDADNLMDLLDELSFKIICEKHNDWSENKKNRISKKISLASLKYYLLNFSTSKDIMFIPEKSISFDGNTGPYLQYTTARIFSLLNKSKDVVINNSNYDLYEFNDDEWFLIAHMFDFEDIIVRAAENYSPMEVTTYLYNLSKYFNKFYHDNPILTADDDIQINIRLDITKAVYSILLKGLDLLGIEPLEEM